MKLFTNDQKSFYGVNRMVLYFLQDISCFEHTGGLKQPPVSHFSFFFLEMHSIFVANDGLSLSDIVTPREHEALAFMTKSSLQAEIGDKLIVNNIREYRSTDIQYSRCSV